MVLRVALRVTLALLLTPGMPLMVVPLPGRTKVQRVYCRLVLRCFGVRITVSGSPIRNLRGVLVVSGHIVLVGRVLHRCGAARVVRCPRRHVHRGRR